MFMVIFVSIRSIAFEFRHHKMAVDNHPKPSAPRAESVQGFTAGEPTFGVAGVGGGTLAG
jgi:hypothetical protein